MIISDSGVDGEMGIDEGHLELVTLGDADDLVLDQSNDAEANDVPALTVPNSGANTGIEPLSSVLSGSFGRLFGSSQDPDPSYT